MTYKNDFFIDISPGVSVGISREDALNFTAKDFAKLYRKTVYGASRREARRWGKEQVAARERMRERLGGRL